jgi:hypothetical protein
VESSKSMKKGKKRTKTCHAKHDIIDIGHDTWILFLIKKGYQTI